jgi:hypothetical protein
VAAPFLAVLCRAPPRSGPDSGGTGLSAGVGTHLAAFTLDGSIRAVQRALHKGICHAPSVVWHAYWRWAALQGIEAEALRGQWAYDPEQVWPDGWLAQGRRLGQRRGSAPAR